jgi:hypothetical protein
MMAATQQQVDDLQAAIAEGVLEVMSAGRKVTYRSLDEMLRVKTMLETELSGTSANGSRYQRYISFRRD